MSTVLITGARAPIALDLARSFARAGWEPHLADSVKPWLARSVRVAQGRLHRLAPPRFAFAAFRRDLEALVARLDPVLIVPTCEEVFYVAEAARLGGYAARVFAPPPELLRRLHSKAEFAALAGALGVAAPATQRVTSREALMAFAPKARQLVFKPEFSRFASHALVRPSPQRLARIEPSPACAWVAQDFVPGEEICVWSAAREGRLVAFAAYKPVWRLGRSSSFYFEADPDPNLVELARRLAAGTGATGHLSYDVIRRDGGGLAPIECNPRGVSGLHLFDGGADLAQAIMGLEREVALAVAPARHLGLAMALMGAPAALATRRWGRFQGDLRRSRDVLSQDDDRWAAPAALLDAVRFAAVGLSRGRSASGQSTDDIEWNGEPIA